MKNLHLLLPCICCCLSLFSIAQKPHNDSETERMQKARILHDATPLYFSAIGRKDSLWRKTLYTIREKKLSSIEHYLDSNCTVLHGAFTNFYPTGKISSLGQYANHNKEGIWISFYENGYIKDSVNYTNNLPIGVKLGWSDMGELTDSIVYQSDGIATAIQWFPNGNISYAGRYTNYNIKQGKWQFFHSNGQISAEEVYKNNILIDKQYFTEDGTIQEDTTTVERKASFPRGLNAFNDYKSQKLNNVGKEIDITKSYETKISFTVTEKGKIIDVRSLLQPEDYFTRIVMNIYKNSPTWEPAINHNRKVPERVITGLSIRAAY